MALNPSTVRRLVGTAVFAGALALPAGVAVAAPYPGGGTPPPAVGGTSASHGATVAAKSSSSHPSTLPFTGSDVAGLVVIGVGAVGVGTVLVRRSRRHAHA